MKIVNEAKLPYKIIGQVIDDCINNKYDDTCYFGKIEYFTIEFKNILYRVQIRYLKKYVEWRFMYYDNDKNDKPEQS